MISGIIAVNKPVGISSSKVTAKVKRLLNEKAGHLGTLDPNACGVLLILTGKATKLVELLQGDKEYVAKVVFEKRYDTADIWGNVIDEKPFCADEEKIKQVLKSFEGKSLQKPPMYSALKKDGVALYKLARQNIAADIKEREIEIKNIEYLSFDAEKKELEFKALVSKGTYIRSLCEDIAKRLDSFGAMSSLCRTKVLNITPDDCVDFDDIDECNIKRYIKNPLEFLDFKKIVLDKSGVKYFLSGGVINFGRVYGKVFEYNFAYDEEGNFLAISQKVENGVRCFLTLD